MNQLKLIKVLNIMGEGTREHPRDDYALPLCQFISQGNCLGDSVSLVNCANCPLELYPDLILDMTDETD